MLNLKPSTPANAKYANNCQALEKSLEILDFIKYIGTKRLQVGYDECYSK